MGYKKEKTIAQIIQSMPLDPEYKPMDNMPIPLHKGVLVRTLQQVDIQKTKSGILLFEGNAEDSTPPHLGIIMAVGPNCSEHVRVGLRCFYNFFVNSFFIVNGEMLAKMDEVDIYYIVPPQVRTSHPLRPAAKVRRGKKIVEQNAFYKREAAADANEKDKKFDKTKGKINPVRNNIN